MRQITFRRLCDEGGYCCQYAFLFLEDLKAGPTSARRVTPEVVAKRFNLERNTASKILRKYREGFIACEDRKRCILVLGGMKKVVPPSLTESTQTFLKLPGQLIPVQRTTVWPMEPTGEVMDAKIISTSQTEWLWISLHIDTQDDLSIKMGDVLYCTPAIWGTVINIDGPLYYLLLPGCLHGQRNKDIRDSANAVRIHKRTEDYKG